MNIFVFQKDSLNKLIEIILTFVFVKKKHLKFSVKIYCANEKTYNVVKYPFFSIKCSKEFFFL